MKLLLACIVISLVFSLVLSATYEQDAFHPDHPEKCFDKTTEHLFNPGEEFQPSGRCFNYKCIKPGHIVGKGCNFVRLDECDELGMDFTKKLPECCPKFSCKDRYGKKVIVNPSME